MCALLSDAYHFNPPLFLLSPVSMRFSFHGLFYPQKVQRSCPSRSLGFAVSPLWYQSARLSVRRAFQLPGGGAPGVVRCRVFSLSCFYGFSFSSPGKKKGAHILRRTPSTVIIVIVK